MTAVSEKQFSVLSTIKAAALSCWKNSWTYRKPKTWSLKILKEQLVQTFFDWKSKFLSFSEIQHRTLCFYKDIFWNFRKYGVIADIFKFLSLRTSLLQFLLCCNFVYYFVLTISPFELITYSQIQFCLRKVNSYCRAQLQLQSFRERFKNVNAILDDDHEHFIGFHATT